MIGIFGELLGTGMVAEATEKGGCSGRQSGGGVGWGGTAAASDHR